MEEQDAIQEDIEKRLQGLRLDDKWHDGFRINKRLNQTETSPHEDPQECVLLTARDRPISDAQDDEQDDKRDEMTPSPAPVMAEIRQAPTAPSERVQDPPAPDPPVQNSQPEPTSTSAPPREQSPTISSRQLLFRFRRPVLNDDETESYETLTMSEVQLIDSEVESGLQLNYDELRLAFGDFDEADEFEEIDEFEDEWEENAVGEGGWDVEGDVYCGGADCGEDFLDDRD